MKREANACDAIVIGAGANGLTAAAVLAKAGRRVLVLDEQDSAGGQGRVVEFAPGFRAAPLDSDAGWLPPAVAKGLGLSLERVLPGSPLSVPVGPGGGEGGEWLTFSRDIARAGESIRRHSPADADRWPRFVTRLHKLAGFLGTLYRSPAPDVQASAPRDLLALLGAARRLRGLGRTDMTEFLRMMPMSVQELLDDWFETQPLKAAVAAGGIRDLRQGPRSGGTTFNLLHYLVGAPSPAGAIRNGGWWQAGPDAFTKAAEGAVERYGGTIRGNAKVRRIQVKDDAVVGVVLEGGEEIEAARVLSTADPFRTLLGLVDPVWLDPEFLHAVKNIKFRGSTTLVMYALDALPETKGLAQEALIGTLTLTSGTADLERAADAAKYGRPSEKPHVEITIPTLRWPTMAPAGKHVVVARAQWGELSADQVTAAIESAVPCFTSRVLHRVALTPKDLEQRYGLTQGAVTQGEMMLDQILFMRPVPGWSRYAMPITGLYLGGAGTHPGPGVLGGPGLLAAQQLLRDS